MRVSMARRHQRLTLSRRSSYDLIFTESTAGEVKMPANYILTSSPHLSTLIVGGFSHVRFGSQGRVLQAPLNGGVVITTLIFS